MSKQVINTNKHKGTRYSESCEKASEMHKVRAEFIDIKNVIQRNTNGSKKRKKGVK